MGPGRDYPCGYSSPQLDYSLSMGQVDGLPHPGSAASRHAAHRWAALEHHVQDRTAFDFYKPVVSRLQLDGQDSM